MSFLDRLDRIVIRTFRIIAGVGVFLVFLWLVSLLQPIFSTPFSDLTLGDLIKALFVGWLAIMAFGGAFAVAFGPGPRSQF